LDNSYRCIAKGILKNKSQIEIPDKAEKQNRTKNRTRQAEWRPRSKSRHRLAEKVDLEQWLRKATVTKSGERVY